MKNLFIYVFIFSLSIPQACNSRVEKTSNLIEIDPDQSVTAKLSEYFDGIDYILLDYPDSLPIVNEYAMLITDDNILVESRETAAVFIFDRRGKLQRVIREYGKGPGEFVLIDGLHVKDERIVIYARPSKQLIFDFEGRLLEENKLELEVDGVYLGKDFNLYHSQHGDGEEKLTFQRVSEGKVHGYLPLKDGYEALIKSSNPWGFRFDSFRERLYYTESHSYNVQMFDKNGYWQESISFDFGRYNIEDKKRLQLANDHQLRQEYFDKNVKVKEVNTFNGFSNYMLATFHLPGQGNHSVFLDNDHQVISQVKEWENDFDGMKVYNHHWAFTDNEIIYQLNSSTFYKQYAASFQGKQVEVKPGNVHDFFEKNREKLKEDMVVLVVLKVR